ncbi:hypothetical protein EB796_011547 [Bugula neritina]|uniref:TBC1 domain-containing protein n=1 Tax=Bugula neritina TaxID=10212 RepID=A0A7J7JXS5_BUGNE|nr:hypothetical protein EB796_011547 [Bugula neritina]
MYDITPFSADVNSHKSAHSEEESADDMHDVTKKDLTTHHTMDVAMLRRQYAKLTRRQRKASLLMMAPVASAPPTIVPNYPSPVVNHLFVGKEMSEKKQVSTPRSRSISVGSQMESVAPALSDQLASRLDFYDSSQQDSRQMHRSKAKKQKSEAASSITEPEVVNQEVKKVVRQTSDTSDEFDGNYYSPHLVFIHVSLYCVGDYTTGCTCNHNET